MCVQVRSHPVLRLASTHFLIATRRSFQMACKVVDRKPSNISPASWMVWNTGKRWSCAESEMNVFRFTNSRKVISLEKLLFWVVSLDKQLWRCALFPIDLVPWSQEQAVGTVTLLVLSRDAFTRLCGNLFEILRRNMVCKRLRTLSRPYVLQESYKSIEIPEANTDDAKVCQSFSDSWFTLFNQEQNGPEEENEDDAPPTPPPVNVRRFVWHILPFWDAPSEIILTGGDVAQCSWRQLRFVLFLLSVLSWFSDTE